MCSCMCVCVRACMCVPAWIWVCSAVFPFAGFCRLSECYTTGDECQERKERWGDLLHDGGWLEADHGRCSHSKAQAERGHSGWNSTPWRQGEGFLLLACGCTLLSLINGLDVLIYVYHIIRSLMFVALNMHLPVCCMQTTYLTDYALYNYVL